MIFGRKFSFNTAVWCRDTYQNGLELNTPPDFAGRRIGSAFEDTFQPVFV